MVPPHWTGFTGDMAGPEAKRGSILSGSPEDLQTEAAGGGSAAGPQEVGRVWGGPGMGAWVGAQCLKGLLVWPLLYKLGCIQARPL